MLQDAALADLDERLDGLMEVVRLSYLIKREGGWGAVCEWGETLSLGVPPYLLVSNLTHMRCELGDLPAKITPGDAVHPFAPQPYF